MKISIISDAHLGFGADSERSEDAFKAFEEAIEKSLDCDAILIPGDMFDERVPGTEVLAKAMEILTKPKLADSKTRIVKGISKDISNISPLVFNGIPVIAIHGTHERRIKGFLNPVEALERAGFLAYIHCNGVVLEKNGEKVCIQGMGGVPDHYAEAVLREWGAKPIDGCYNIFMLHQSLTGYVNARHTLDIDKLPSGFDFYICGHHHEKAKTTCHNSPLLIPGSLILTQLGRGKGDQKGIWKLDTSTSDLDFVPLTSQRKFYYIESNNLNEVENKLNELLSHSHELKPIVRIVLQDVDSVAIKKLQEMFGDKLLLSIKKETKEEEIQSIDIEEHKLSVEELGRKLLRENLSNAGLDTRLFEQIFELLLEKKTDDAAVLLLEKIKKDTQKNKNGD